MEPTVEPTMEPTVEPTAKPTVEPTVKPTLEPTAKPTVEPTMEPTVEPTVEPTLEPTVEPTAEPTEGEVGQTDALSAAEWLDATHPNRSIQVVPDWGEGPIELGVEVTLVAHITGYEDLETRVFWQVNRGAGWETIDDSGSLRYTFTLDAENSQWQWRAGVAVQPVE